MAHTLELLNRLLPGVDIQLTSGEAPDGRWERIDLPAAEHADYHFEVWLQPELQIQARLHNADPNADFWGMTFELGDFRGSRKEAEQSLCRVIEQLVEHESRIIQSKGWLTWRFECQCNDGGWSQVASWTCFRFANFKIPSILGKTKTYHSAPLVLKQTSV